VAVTVPYRRNHPKRRVIKEVEVVRVDNVGKIREVVMMGKMANDGKNGK
jgi:hypothetical protein